VSSIFRQSWTSPISVAHASPPPSDVGSPVGSTGTTSVGLLVGGVVLLVDMGGVV
jgi:hypothetical protein